MQCRRERVAAIRNYFDLTRRLNEFKAKHGLVKENSVELTTLMSVDHKVHNPQFGLPDRDRLERLFLQTLYESDDYPLIDFLMDILAKRVELDDDFGNVLKELSGLSHVDIDRMYKMREFSQVENSHILDHLVRKKESEKESFSNLVIKRNEMTMILRIIISKFNENPFADNVNTWDDIVDNLSMEYAINGRKAPEMIVNYITKYFEIITIRRLFEDDFDNLEMLSESLGFSIPGIKENISPVKINHPSSEVEIHHTPPV